MAATGKFKIIYRQKLDGLQSYQFFPLICLKVL